MKAYVIFFMIFYSAYVSAGSLYTFDENPIKTTALNWIKAHYKEFKGVKLKHKYSITSIDKQRKLVVSVFFSYVDDNIHGLSYTCAKVDEYGSLLNVNKDIEATKHLGIELAPNVSVCWGKP